MLDFFDSDTDYDLEDLKEWLFNTDDPNTSFHLFCKHGYLEGVELFLQHPLINPKALNSWGLRDAIKQGHWRVVRLLLQDGRVNYGIGLVEAADCNLLALTEFIIDFYSDKIDNLALVIEHALKKASYNESVEVTEYLLEQHYRVTGKLNAWKNIDASCLEEIVQRKIKTLLPRITETYLLLKTLFTTVVLDGKKHCALPKQIVQEIVSQKYLMEHELGSLQRYVVKRIFKLE